MIEVLSWIAREPGVKGHWKDVTATHLHHKRSPRPQPLFLLSYYPQPSQAQPNPILESLLIWNPDSPLDQAYEMLQVGRNHSHWLLCQKFGVMLSILYSVRWLLLMRKMLHLRMLSDRQYCDKIIWRRDWPWRLPELGLYGLWMNRRNR